MKSIKLGEVSRIYNGNSINEKVKANKFTGLLNGTTYIATKDISYTYQVDYENGVKIPASNGSEFKIAKKGAVLLCAEGGSAGRKMAIIDRDVFFGNKLFCFECAADLNSKFLFYYLQAPTFQDLFKSSITGLIGGVSLEKVRNLPINLPSLEKQSEIVERLDRAFAEIDLLEKNLEIREGRADQLIQSLLGESYGNIKTSTAQLQEQSIGEICEVGDGNHSSKYPTKNEMISVGVPFIRAQNIINGTIDDTDILYISRQKHETLRKGHLKAGDILITNRGEIGKLAIVPPKFQGSNLNSQIAWLRCGRVVRNSYLYYFLKSEGARRFFDLGTSGSTLQQLTISKLKDIKVPVVSLLDQDAIVKKLDSAFAEIDSLKAQFKKDKCFTDSLRQSLLSNAFTKEELVA